jgi:hypothetical protein
MSVHKVHVKGGVKWEVRYRDHENRNRAKRFARKTGRDGADEFDEEMAGARRSGEIINPDRENMAVAEFWKDVFLETRHMSTGTRRRRKALWAPKKAVPQVWHLQKKWAKWRLRDINRRESVMQWHAEMRRAGATDSMMRNAHDLLVTIVSHAIELDYIRGRSRIEGFVMDYAPQRFEDVWLPVQIESVRNYFLASSNPNNPKPAEREWRQRRNAELTSFIGYQAARPGEAVAVTWPRVLNPEQTRIGTAVDIRNSARVIDPDEPDLRERTKTGKPRSGKLETAVRDDLTAWWMYCGRPRTGLVFPYQRADVGDPDARWNPDNFSNWRRDSWLPALSAVNLPPRPLKHLRHSCVSMWIREGLNLKTVADRAGHTMVVCEQTYAHQFASLDPHEKFKISDAIAAARGERTDDAATG